MVMGWRGLSKGFRCSAMVKVVERQSAAGGREVCRHLGKSDQRGGTTPDLRAFRSAGTTALQLIDEFMLVPQIPSRAGAS